MRSSIDHLLRSRVLNHNWIFVAENLVFGGGTILVVELF